MAYYTGSLPTLEGGTHTTAPLPANRHRQVKTRLEPACASVLNRRNSKSAFKQKLQSVGPERTEPMSLRIGSVVRSLFS